MDCAFWNERHRTRLACRRPGAGAQRDVFIFIFWSRCCCCCCVLLLLPTTSVLKRREVPPTHSSFSVSAASTAVTFASMVLLLLLLRRDIHFYSLVEVPLLLIIFLLGCADPAAVLALLTMSVLKQREVPATVSSFYVSVFYTAMLRTSIIGGFDFCPLECYASVMVVDCAAVETGCMLEKYVTSPLLLLSFASIPLLLLLLRRDMHFYCLV